MGHGPSWRIHHHRKACHPRIRACLPRTVPTSPAFPPPPAFPCRILTLANNRLVSIARGEQQYFDPNGIPTAVEGCKSNALMRCCKDLGIASDLWDPRFIRKFKKDYCEEKFAEHVMTKRKKKLWRRKGDVFEYPYKLLTSTGFS